MPFACAVFEPVRTRLSINVSSPTMEAARGNKCETPITAFNASGQSKC